MPRRSTKTNSSADEQPPRVERVRFIFEPDRNSPNGITFSWLIHKAYEGKEKVGAATRSFWMPFACRDSGKYSEAELKDLAQQCVWRLEEQIQHLRENFEIDAPSRLSSGANGSGSLPPTLPQPLTPVPAAPVEEPHAQFFGNLDLSVEEDMLGDFGDALG